MNKDNEKTVFFTDLIEENKIPPLDEKNLDLEEKEYVDSYPYVSSPLNETSDFYSLIPEEDESIYLDCCVCGCKIHPIKSFMLGEKYIFCLSCHKMILESVDSDFELISEKDWKRALDEGYLTPLESRQILTTEPIKSEKVCDPDLEDWEDITDNSEIVLKKKYDTQLNYIFTVVFPTYKHERIFKTKSCKPEIHKILEKKEEIERQEQHRLSILANEKRKLKMEKKKNREMKRKKNVEK